MRPVPYLESYQEHLGIPVKSSGQDHPIPFNILERNHPILKESLCRQMALEGGNGFVLSDPGIGKEGLIDS